VELPKQSWQSAAPWAMALLRKTQKKLVEEDDITAC
jgi:hypothetical protein